MWRRSFHHPGDLKLVSLVNKGVVAFCIELIHHTLVSIMANQFNCVFIKNKGLRINE